jgi:dihydroneopterin aldolase
VRRIQSELASRHFSLLEALAEHIAQILLNEFKAPWAKISVAKLQAIRGSKMVGICIERSQ